MEFHNVYRPLTAEPFRSPATYKEILPSPPLRPWIRCFWEIDGTACYTKTLVIPDTCMDIIFNLKNDDVPGCFCGIDDHAVWVNQYDTGKQFAVRFYPWAVALLTEENLKEVKNLRCSAKQYFPALQQALGSKLISAQTQEERIAVAERYFLRNLDIHKANAWVLQACWEITIAQGGLCIEDLSRSLHFSPRQIERRFQECIGISPKKMACLIRYQNLWRDVLRPEFNIHDAVAKYNFTDQSHLLHDFRKYHLLTITEAKTRAYQNVSHFYNTEPQ